MISKALKSNIPYLIAETAYSFEGNRKYLLEQVNLLKETELDCIKFHMMFNKDEYVVQNYKALNQYLEEWILEKDVWKKILSESKKNKLDTLVLVDDMESVIFCKENSELVDGIEVHAACINDLKILNAAINFAKTYNKVFFIGVSGFEFQELSSIIEHLRNSNLEKVVLMYGFQNFPTNLEDINLSKIPLIEEAFGYKVGYADHTKYNDENKKNLIYTSYAMGANIQEVHYILEEGKERTDYITGLNNQNLDKIKEKLEKIYLSIGEIDFRLNEGEKKYLNFRKVPVYKTNLSKGTTLSEDNVTFKRVKNPKRQHKFREIENHFGKIITKNVKADTEIKLDDLKC